MKHWAIGEVVENIVSLKSESGTIIPVGTKLRIVAIAPKVYMMPKDQYHDGLPDFFNAVLAEQINDYHDRIRADFCTIKKG